MLQVGLLYSITRMRFFFSFEQVSSFLSGHQQKTSFNISQSKNKSNTPFKIQPNIWTLSKQAMSIIASSNLTMVSSDETLLNKFWAVFESVIFA